MAAVRPSASRSRDISTRGMPWNSTTGGAGGGATVSWLGGRAFSVRAGSVRAGSVRADALG